MPPKIKCNTELFRRLLEDSPELKEPFLVAGIADAAANEEWTEGGFGYHAGLHIVGEPGLRGEPVHLGDFIGADDVDLLAEERRQSQKLAKVAGAKKIVLLSIELVGAVGA